jgi:integrase
MNRGKILTSKPLPPQVIEKLREHLANDPMHLAWLNVSVGSALRGGDVLGLTRDQLTFLPDGRCEVLTCARKTGKLTKVLLAPHIATGLQEWLRSSPNRWNLVFFGQRGRLGTSTLNARLKAWCAAVGYVEGRVTTHSTRKSFVRNAYERGIKLATLMHICGHSSERNTLVYCGITAEDEERAYSLAL